MKVGAANVCAACSCSSGLPAPPHWLGMLIGGAGHGAADRAARPCVSSRFSGEAVLHSDGKGNDEPLIGKMSAATSPQKLEPPHQQWQKAQKQRKLAAAASSFGTAESLSHCSNETHADDHQTPGQMEEKMELWLGFKDTISVHAQMFQDIGQNDAHKFLTSVLDQMRNLTPLLSETTAVLGTTYNCPDEEHLSFIMLKTRTCNR
ncbi:hypothetical protein Q5P01_021241 [Channa striata]|uniref:Uncharacterized protein n=1 Tax=Channa striata TaxID=64152 RepID=A0AA88LTZ5_CHASR|nr:hypothetical protein Q5P01_021241 [Channa striata]